jgi:hypothetical protein
MKRELPSFLFFLLFFWWCSPSASAQFTVLLDVEEPSCGGFPNGSITALPSGGFTPFSYIWNTGDTTQTIDGLTPGFYSVTVTDTLNQQAFASVTMNEPPPISATLVVNDCDAPGSITAIPGGGSGVYNYSWNTGDTTQTITYLVGGTYCVTLTDTSYCGIVKCAVITETPPLVEVITTDILCTGEMNGTAIATVSGGLPPYTFEWNTGDTNDTLINLGPGTYEVTVTDANGCTGVGSGMVVDPPPVFATIDVIHPTCVGEMDGEATAVPSGGTPPYSFEWNTGATTQTITGLGAGTYTVTVSDANNCEKVASAVLIEQSDIEVVATATPVTCADEDNGTATATASNGVPPYSYLWSTGDTSQTIIDLSPGIYLVTATDAVGCSDTTSVEISADDLLDLEVDVTPVSICGGSDGMATALPSGGVTPYTYEWSTGDTTQTITGLDPGPYLVIVTDATGCMVMEQISVGAPPDIEVEIDGVNETCEGSMDGSATAIPDGTPPYTYIWNTGETTQTISGLVPGTYSVTVSDDAGCQGVGQVTIESAPGYTLDTIITNVLCFGDNTGSIEVEGWGGVPPYSYEWDTGDTTGLITGLPVGDYTVTVTDNVGCFLVETYTITQPDVLTVEVTATDVSCASSNSGTVTAMAAGGTPPYTYAWNTGQTGAVLTGLGPGIYEVTATDANGCTAIDQDTIFDLGDFLIDIVVDNVDCAGDSTGSITVTPTGGVPPYSYLWNTGDTTSTLANLPAGDYTVTVSDAGGCETTETITVSEPPPVEVTVTINSFQGCDIDTVTVTASASGGTPPYTYVWSDGTTGPVNELTPGIYFVIATDVNGCPDTAIVDIPTPPEVDVEIIITELLCFGDEDAEAEAIPIGGTAPFMFLWNTGDTTQVIDQLGPGTYSVTLTDANGCVADTSAMVVEPPQLTVSVITTDTECPNDSTGTATATVNGGTPPFTFAWSNGENGPVIEDLPAGVYTVTVTDVNGCMAVDEGIVESLDGPELELDATDVSCFGAMDGSITAIASSGLPPYMYAWSNGGNTSTISNLGPGTYSATVTDENGCSAVASVAIEEPDTLVVSLVSSTSASCEGSEDGSAEVEASGGTPAYSYTWSDGQTGPIATNLNPGTIMVTVEDMNGCTDTLSIEIGIENDLDVAVEQINPTCQGQETGSAIASASGGVAPYTYVWSNGENGPVITGLGEGSYTVTATDDLGCMATNTVSISTIPSPTCEAFVTQEISLPGGSDGAVSVTASGGAPPYSYEWSNGVTTQENTGLPEGIYTVTVTDDNGCFTTCSVSLGDPPAACVGDKVWVDEDEDGIQDLNEPGYPNLMVTLEGTANTGDPVTQTTFTDASGMYLFDLVPPGSYKLTFNLPNTYEFTDQDQGSNDELDSDVDPATGMTVTFNLPAGDCDLRWDAGLIDICENITDPGLIAGDEFLCGPGNDPGIIVEVAPPVGGSGALEYLWMKSEIGGPFNQTNWSAIPNSNTPDYDPGPIQVTTYYIRCVRREGCENFLETNTVIKEVGDVAVADITGPEIVCIDEVVTFSAANGGNNVTYSWDFGPNANPPTSTDQVVNVSWPAQEVVTVQLTVENDSCVSMDWLTVYVINTPVFCDPDNFIINAEVIDNAEVQLSWLAPFMVGELEFIVERSKDGLQYHEIGRLDYDPNEVNYGFTDPQPEAGRNYYRVMVKGSQLGEVYSNVEEAILYRGNQNVLIYPNPTTDLVYVEMLWGATEEQSLELYSTTGQLLQTIQVDPNLARQEINLSDLPIGMYYLVVRGGEGGLRSFKILRQ